MPIPSLIFELLFSGFGLFFGEILINLGIVAIKDRKVGSSRLRGVPTTCRFHML